MKFTLGWLKDYLATDAGADEIAARLTAIGLECESFGLPYPALEPFLTARILEARPHPEADKLQVCAVDTGKGEPLQIVCGAPNARAGLAVTLAPVGVRVPGPDMVIKKAKIRGVESCGMLCSYAELGLGADGEGIIELPADTLPGMRFIDAAGLNDIVFDVNVTPDRGDCLSVYGLARDLAASGLGRFLPPAFPAAFDAGAFDSPVTVETAPDSGCSAYAGLYIRGMNNAAEIPAYIRKRLEAVGARLISPAVDIVNYMLYSFGRPMHAFDADKLQGGKLTVRRSRAGEAFSGLNGTDYVLPEGVCVVADSAGAQALGGVLGGAGSACTETTRNVFLESALFSRHDVASAGRKLAVSTESRKRFERGTDPELMKAVAALTARELISVCGGEISRMTHAAGNDLSAPRTTVRFRPSRVKALTGIEATDAEITAPLTALGFGLTADTGEEGALIVAVPSWRHDIEREEDVTEEAARMLSYDRIPETPLPLPDPRATRPKAGFGALPSVHVLLKRMKRALAASGMHEALCWSFVSEAQHETYGEAVPPARILNPISQEWAVLRSSLMPGLLRTLSENAARGLSDYALFETGQVFLRPVPGAQKTMAAGVRVGRLEIQHPHRKAAPVSVFDAKADLLACLAEAGVAPEQVRTETEAPSYYHPGRKGSLWLGKDRLGVFGQLHPDILEREDLTRFPVAGFECDVEASLKCFKPFKPKQPPALSPFQASERDFCFVIDVDLPLGKLTEALRKAAKEYVEQLTLFDLYTGKGVPEGKVSAAFSVRLRPVSAPWTDEELRNVTDGMIAAAGKLGAVLRS